MMNYVTVLPSVPFRKRQDHCTPRRLFYSSRTIFFRKSQRSLSVMVKIEVSKPVCLVDEDVVVRVTGLGSREGITLLVTTEQDKVRFWSYGTFKATDDGVVDCSTDKPLTGSYTNIDPMGLFWSLTSVPWEPRGQRLYTAKTNGRNRRYCLSVFPESEDPVEYLNNGSECLASIEHYRGYKRNSVKRIPIKHDKIQGTVFVPEGQGPFPGVIDMYGGLVYLFESRAALLASHGFVTLALAYVHGKDLPDDLGKIDTAYFEEAVDWFISQECVQTGGIGVQGLCLGGTIAMWMAENIPTVKAVVNLNGMPFPFDTWTHNGENIYKGSSRVNLDKAYQTEEGVIIRDLFHADERYFYKSWRHGAKLLICYSGDDLMTRKENHIIWHNIVPEKYRCNVHLQYYPGAGHLIEPPYMPSLRAIDARKRAPTCGICPEKYYYELILVGGYPKQHAAAQKDCWARVLKFLKENLTHNKIPGSKL